MRKRTAWIVVMALAASAGAVGWQDRSTDERAIRSHIESIFDAFIQKDRDKLASTHGRNWRGYLTGSRTVIKGRDGYVRAAVGDGPMGPRGQGMVGYEIVEYDTAWYDNVAVVNFVADVHHKRGTQPHTARLTLMDIYAKEDGEWIQVASQTSNHPEYQQRLMSEHQVLPDPVRTSLLEAREKVWRAWYGGDTAALGELLPPELMTLSPGTDGFTGRDGIVAASRQFASGGGKLLRLQFPRTEIQAYGATAIIYTSYELEVAEAGKTRVERGKATEVFVRRGGRWLNTGWQLAPEMRASGTPRPALAHE
jgi:ketosteroid isomerase-like protein